MNKRDRNKKVETFQELGVQWIGLELNNTCNIRCSFCPISKPDLQRRPKGGVLNKETVFKVLKEIKDDGTLEYVALNGYGEPFLYQHFEAVLNYCMENNIRMRFGTNGTLFTKQNIELLKKYQPEELVISIQYFLEDGYQKVKGTKIDRQVWLNQIANFLKIHMESDLKINVQLAIAGNSMNSFRNRVCGLRLGDVNLPFPNKKFYHQLGDFIEDFCVNRLNLTFDNKNIKKIEKGSYLEYYKINSKIGFEIKHFSDLTNFYYFKQTNTVDCQMPYLIINAQGDVLMCCVDYIGETSLGNVQDRTVKEILRENYSIYVNKNNEKAKIALCRKCCGERTYRGLFLRKFYSGVQKGKLFVAMPL